MYLNNLGLLKIDVAGVNALVLSRGHFDHLGGLIGFLEARRPRMRKDLRLYTGGEDNFCHRLNRNPDGSFSDFGILDRHRLKALDVEAVLSEVPVVIADHAFTTGAVPRTSMAELKKLDPEHVLPMHCSGQNFIDLAIAEMPEKLVLCTTGRRFTFTT